MFPDGIMPVQGSGLATIGMGSRQARVLAFAVAGVALALISVLPRVAPIPGAGLGCGDSSAGESAIIALCSQGRAADAVRLADAQLGCQRPDSAEAAWLHYLRGGALRLLGRESEATTDYSAAARIGRDTLDADAEVTFLGESGDTAQASELARQILRDSRTNKDLVNNACWALTIYGAGHSAEAVPEMRNLVSSSDDADRIDTYAWSLYLTGDRQGAMRQETRALDLATRFGSDHIRYFRACLQGMSGDREGAAKQLRMLFQEDVSYTSAWDTAQRFNDLRS